MSHRYILENADSPTDTCIIDIQTGHACYRGSDRTASALVGILNRLHALEQGIHQNTARMQSAVNDQADRIDALNARIIELEAFRPLTTPAAPPTAPAIAIRPEASALVAALHGLPNAAKVYLEEMPADKLHHLARTAHFIQTVATQIARRKEDAKNAD